DIAPSANAGADQVVLPHAIVDLNGSGSFDPDDGIVSYSWVQVDGPGVKVHGANAADASFVASHPGPIGVSLIFQLQVTDHFGLTTRAQCIVNEIRGHLPPVASAGSNQNVATLSSVTLDGSGSSDPSGSPVAYRWKQIRGVPVTLSDPTAQNPIFSAPSVSGAQSPDLLFMLTVTDPRGLSASAKRTVTVQ
ncbi:MAG: PKD domain-containing protein, partial [Dissulfurispiraceae bacterium]